MTEHASESPTERGEYQQSTTAEMVKSEAGGGNASSNADYANVNSSSANDRSAADADGAVSSSPVTADQLAYMHHHRASSQNSAESAAAADYMPSVIGATANYGNSYGYASNYGNSCGSYLNSPAMASFLYPHLYSSMPGLHASPIHGNGQLTAHSADAGAAGAGMEDYILSDNPSDGAGRGDPSQHGGDTSGYSSLEGGSATGAAEEGQTGPIRGAYSQRSEHGAHVWRPY